MGPWLGAWMPRVTAVSSVSGPSSAQEEAVHEARELFVQSGLKLVVVGG